MNSLSWMIYLADLAGALGKFCIIYAAIGTVTAVVWVSFYYDDDFKKHRDAGVKPHLGKILGSVLCSILLAVFIPSKNTIYAIAASEMGEDVLNSKTGGKAIQALDAWLDRQIEGEAHD